MGLAVIRRPLLLSSIAPELASARGIRTRWVGLAFMVAMAVAVGLSSIAIGSILSTALLIGPAATALRLTQIAGVLHGRRLRARRGRPPGSGSCSPTTAATGTRPSQGLPVSFFIVAITFAGYLCSGLPAVARNATPRRRRSGAADSASNRCPRRRLMFSGFMVNAWEIGTIVAVVGGVVGFFVVLRGAAFPAHAIPNGAFAGAAGASLIGVNPLLGLGVFAVGRGARHRSLGRRGRPDVATALALVMMLALGAAFLSQSTEYEPEIFSLLFGEILGVSSSEILPDAVLGLVCIVAVGVLYRPLLLTSLVPEIAEAARGAAAGSRSCSSSWWRWPRR